MDNARVLLHLSLIDGVGPVTIGMLRQGTQDLRTLYHYTEHDCIQYKQLSPSTAQKVVAGLANMRILEDELTLLERKHVNWVALDQEGYPDLLRSLYMPPPVLYYTGVLPQARCSLAVVGSRKASRYGHYALEKIIPDLVERDVVIVSGGALGADSMAHQVALDAGGKTVAIIGSGLLDPYPAVNKKLFDRIASEDGAVVSPFPLAAKAHPGNFPARNRIIAGMSNACLVVQAAARSGALITAQYALEQGKEVMAVPGMIHDALSEGCHGLIKDGAFLVASAEDVLAALGTFVSLPKVGSIIPADRAEDQMVVPQESELSFADRLYQACLTPRAVEELVQELSCPMESLMKELFELQLAGRVQQNFAGLWQSI